jgi:hypothetical protein
MPVWARNKHPQQHLLGVLSPPLPTRLHTYYACAYYEPLSPHITTRGHAPILHPHFLTRLYPSTPTISPISYHPTSCPSESSHTSVSPVSTPIDLILTTVPRYALLHLLRTTTRGPCCRLIVLTAPSSTGLKSASLSPACSSCNDRERSRTRTNVPLSCSAPVHARLNARLVVDVMRARESSTDWPGQLSRLPLVGGVRLLGREVE